MKNSYKDIYQMNKYVIVLIDELLSDYANIKKEMTPTHLTQVVDYGFYAKKLSDVRKKVDEIANFLNTSFDRNIPKNKELYVVFCNAIADFGFLLNDEIDIAEKLNKKAKALGRYGMLEYRKDVKRRDKSSEVSQRSMTLLHSIFSPPRLSQYQLDLINHALFVGNVLGSLFYDTPRQKIDYEELKTLFDSAFEAFDEFEFLPKDFKIRDRIINITKTFYEVVECAEYNVVHPEYDTVKQDLHNMTEYFYSLAV